MKSNQSNSAARSTPSASSTSNAQAPSVPISVYRELAAELQTTRAMVDALNGKNQHLDQENQKLRQEMQRVVHSVLALQPWIDASEEIRPMPPPRKNTPRQAVPEKLTPERPTWEETAAASAIAAKLRPNEPAAEWLTETATTPQRISQSNQATKLSGLWLTLIIIGIIVTAFGAGFLIMRPFLPTK